MREVDRRGKYSRRIFLQGAASAVPVVAVAASAGLGIEDAWAADATTLTPATLKTLVKVARDIYPHDMLVDSYYITAIKPWDAKAAKDPAIKALLEDGVRRLDHQVKAVGHQAVAVNLPPRLVAPLSQGGQEHLAVIIVAKEPLLMVPAVHHVVNRPGVLDAQLASHKAWPHSNCLEVSEGSR